MSSTTHTTPAHTSAGGDTETLVDARAVLDQLAVCGITHVVTVPDFIQMSVHHLLADNYLPDVEVIHTSTEDEAVVIAAGLYLGGKSPVVIVQNQGLYACVNNLRAIGLDVGLPIMLMIGQFGREKENFGHSTANSTRRVVRLLEPLLDTLEIPHLPLEVPADLGNVARVFELSRERSWPAALIVGVPTGWPPNEDYDATTAEGA